MEPEELASSPRLPKAALYLRIVPAFAVEQNNLLVVNPDQTSNQYDTPEIYLAPEELKERHEQEAQSLTAARGSVQKDEADAPLAKGTDAGAVLGTEAFELKVDWPLDAFESDDGRKAVLSAAMEAVKPLQGNLTIGSVTADFDEDTGSPASSIVLHIEADPSGPSSTDIAVAFQRKVEEDSSVLWPARLLEVQRRRSSFFWRRQRNADRPWATKKMSEIANLPPVTELSKTVAVGVEQEIALRGILVENLPVHQVAPLTPLEYCTRLPHLVLHSRYRFAPLFT